MKKFYFNRINSVKSGNSGSASASPKARKLRMESLENRHLLAVGAPFPDACVEPDVSASAFYATETVGSSTSGATAIDISSALAEDSTVPDFVDEFDSTSADDLIQFSDDSEPEDELIDESQTEEDLGPVQTVLTLMQYFNSLGIKDYSLDYPRDVFFYSSIDPECYLSTLDFSDESTLFIDLGAREDQKWNLARAFETTITRSGGGNEPEEPEVEPPVVGEITSTGSPFIYERNDGSVNAPANASYFTVHIPEVPYDYIACLEFAPASNSGAIWGTDYGLVQAGVANDVYYPLAPATPNPNPPRNYDEVSGGFDYCIVPFNDGIAEDPESFTIRFFIQKVSGGGERYYGNTLTVTILDDDRTVNVSWGDGNYNGHGAKLSANPRGGGARVYPEQESENVNSLKKVVSLNFILNEPAPVGGQVVYFKFMDPDNYISLGNGQTSLSETYQYSPNDNYQSFLENVENYSGYTYGNTYSIEIEEGETQVSLQIGFPTSYAGDNWIVFAGTTESSVSSSVLGDSEFDRFTILRTNVNQQVSQSQMLTVWRTLWLELDQLLDGNENGAGYPEIGSITVNAFEEACISVKKFEQDIDCTTSIIEQGRNYQFMALKSDQNGELQIYCGINPYDRDFDLQCSSDVFTGSKDIPPCTTNYWTMRAIGAFLDNRAPGNLGYALGQGNPLYENTLFVYNDVIVANVTGYNVLNNTNIASIEITKECTLTHEIGHFFTLEHADFDDCVSVMTAYEEDDYIVNDLLPIMQHFSIKEICTIQSRYKPE